MIVKRLITFFTLVLLMTACYQYEKPDKPKDLISKDKMVDVLIDVKLVASINTIDKEAIDKNNINAETYVFSKHNIDSLQFAQSNNYYSFYVKEYEEIYGRVKDSLEKLKAIYKDLEIKEEEEAKAKRKRDSIKAIEQIKDSLGIIKYQDSLKTNINIDSLSKTLLKNKLERVKLITPVSDTVFQSQ